MTALVVWQNFYVIVGSAAAALTGLMFVAIALIVNVRGTGTAQQLDAFATPTVVHFGAVLLQAAIATAPWPSLIGIQVAFAVYGLAGAIYTIIVLLRQRRQHDYQPVFEDWLFHTALPFIAYTIVTTSAIVLSKGPTIFLFLIAGAGVLLLLVGIHNAWDTVTYIVTVRWNKQEPDA